MDYNLEIQKLLLKKEEAYLPNDKINFIKQAIAIAAGHNDVQWSFDLRCELIEEEACTTRYTETIPAFAWLLDAYDSDPDLFDIDYIISRYRWVINQMFRNVGVSVAQIQEIFVDYKLRLQKHGYSLRSFYSAKADFGFFLDNMEIVQENIELRDKYQANSFDYWINELYVNIEYVLRKNNTDYALQLEKEIAESDLEFVYYPFAVYTSLMRHFTRRKKYNEAHKYFLKAENCLTRLENDQSTIPQIGCLIYFLSIKDKKKAWHFFEKYINWTIDADDCTITFFSIDILNLLREKQTKVLNVSPQLPWYRSDNTYNTTDLYNYYYNLAHDMVHRFDERNGNNIFSKRLEQYKDRCSNWFKSFLVRIFKRK